MFQPMRYHGTVGVVMDHVRKIPTAFTPFAQSGMNNADVHAVQHILDYYVQPPMSSETPAKLEKKQARTTTMVMVPTQQKIADHTKRHDDLYKANRLAAAFLATDDPKPRPSKARKLLAHASDASAAKSTESKPTPPSRRSRLLFASFFDETVITHIWGVGLPHV